MGLIYAASIPKLLDTTRLLMNSYKELYLEKIKLNLLYPVKGIADI